jgi:hypothetical protein
MTRHIAYSVAVLEENEEYTSTSSLMAGMHAVVRIFPKIFPFRFDIGIAGAGDAGSFSKCSTSNTYPVTCLKEAPGTYCRTIYFLKQKRKFVKRRKFCRRRTD